MPDGGTHGLARVLSKRGLCSRTQAARWIVEGRVRVDGRLVRDPESRTRTEAAIVVEGLEAAAAVERRYVMLDKPRGLVTTTADEQGRDTVYRAFDGAGLPWLAPVGRLDKASEGLLLFTNDPAWAAAVTSPEHGPDKTYHVQVDALLDTAALDRLREGVVDAGEHLAAKHVRELRRGTRNSWLEIVLDEGRNRQIRRLLAAHGIGVLRLVRVAIGALTLGALVRGAWRDLTAEEVAALAQARSARDA
ncbi:pseudouridine synthase [Dokdonella sp. MW10]|uniref:pseudouridine synthase n=1 Tax=Dokdonella sp. MW10 TaxID=2992926 RepID=UPI003F801226